MKTLIVDLGDRSYPIYVGCSLTDSLSLIACHIKSRQVMIVTNQTIAPLYLEEIRKILSDYTCDFIILPDGEEYKTLATIERVFNELLAGGYSRSSTLIALGGGVIGDMTGFASACYQRGVSFIQIPTTLLAQVDSSVGGKTGVNHPLGKNMIGAFHQPSCVLIDVNTLSTLPDREYVSGLAEVIKYGLIRDLEFFEWIEKNADRLLVRDEEALVHAIHRSCMNKADIVAEDETEEGVRALLNFGHTFGHAIESWSQYKLLLHGEAVAVGMTLASRLSVRMGLLDQSEFERVQRLLKKCSLPTAQPEGMEPEDFIGYMKRDKKVVDGSIRLILLESIGNAVISSCATTDDIIGAIESNAPLLNSQPDAG